MASDSLGGKGPRTEVANCSGCSGAKAEKSEEPGCGLSGRTGFRSRRQCFEVSDHRDPWQQVAGGVPEDRAGQRPGAESKSTDTGEPGGGPVRQEAGEQGDVYGQGTKSGR